MTDLKFRSELDQSLFLVESNLSIDNLNAKDDVYESKLNEARDRFFKLKDFRKSQIAKHSWRVNRYTHMKGIKRFHRSVAGKKFHRNLSRIMSTRLFENVKPDLIYHEMLAISSLKSQLLVEYNYYIPMNEMVDYSIFTDYTLDILSSVETKILESKQLSVDEMEHMLRLCSIDSLNEEFNFNIPESIYNSDSTYEVCKYINKNCNISLIHKTSLEEPANVSVE